jgi:hypothetical protein
MCDLDLKNKDCLIREQSSGHDKCVAVVTIKDLKFFPNHKKQCDRRDSNGLKVFLRIIPL